MKRVLVTLCIIVTCIVPTAVSAVNMEELKFNEGNISFDLPYDWYCEIFDTDPENIYYYNTFGISNLVSLETEDLEIYANYVFSEDLSFDSIDDEETAVEMFEDDREIIDDVLNDEYGAYSLDDYKIIDGKDHGKWLRIKCNCWVDGDSYVYINELNSEVMRVIYVRRIDEIAITDSEQLKTIDQAVRSYKDTDYNKEIIQYYDPEEQGGFDVIDTLAFLFLALIGLCFKLFITAKRKDIKIADNSVRNEMEIVEAEKQNIEEEANEVQSVVESFTYSTSYEESLRSLYKSGIMSKQELNEMLKKYHSNKNTINERREVKGD